MYSSNVSIKQSSVIAKVFGLLALTLIPTIIGVFAGIPLLPFAAAHKIIFTILFLVVSFGLIFMISALKDSPAGFISLFLFTFIEGIGLSGMIVAYTASAAGVQTLALAIGITITVFFVMALVGMLIKRDIHWLGQFLFVGLIILIIASIANIFIHSAALNLTLSTIGALIFSAYILYDVNKIVKGGCYSVTMATLSLYLDIINLFISILSLLGNRK